MPSGQGLPFYASLDDNAFTRGIRSMEGRAESGARSIGRAFLSAAEPIAALGSLAAGAFGGFAIASGVREVYDLTKGLGELSDQTGVSVGRLYELGREFQNAGLEADDAGAAINKMQKFLQQGGPGGDEKVFDALRLLKLNFLDVKNLSPERQFQVIGKAIEGMTSPTARAAASMEIFGKSGGRLLRVFSDPKFANGGDLSGRAEILQKNAALFEDASVKLNRAGDVFKSFYTGIAERVAGPLVEFLDRLEATDLTSLGEGFGDELIVGATAVVDMLLALKKAGFVDTAKQFGSALKEGAEILLDVVTRIGKMFAQDIKDIAAIAKFFGMDNVPDAPTTPDGSQPPASSPPSAPSTQPSPDGAASSAPATPAPTDAGTTDRVTVENPRTSLFQTPGMQWGKMGNQPIVNPAADEFTGQGMQWGQMQWARDGAKTLRDSVFDETANVGLKTGSLFTGGLQTSGLSGPGSDTAEDSRQNVQQIRDQIKYENPLLQGTGLESAVRQEQQKQQNQARVQQYRDAYDKQHPAEAEARKAQADKTKGATSTDIDKLGTKLAQKIDMLFAQ